MARRLAALPCLLAASLLLAGCTGLDPYHRQGVWQPTGANAANLAAMVANPQDLIRGHGSSMGQLSKDQVVGVDRVWSGAARSGSGGSSSGGSGAAAAAPGG